MHNRWGHLDEVDIHHKQFQTRLFSALIILPSLVFSLGQCRPCLEKDESQLTIYSGRKVPEVLYAFFLFVFLFFLAVLGLRFCARAFSSCGKRGPLFIAVRGPLTVAASLVAEHSLQTRRLRLSSCGSRAQSLRGMWDLPRPGLEPVSPALAGRFSTTAPPRKPYMRFIIGNQIRIRQHNFLT